jgi:hypothetical protein
VTGVFHIAVAMKPLGGNFAQNGLNHGVAGLNIDVCRIEGKPPSVPQPAGNTGEIYGFKNGVGRNGEMSDNTKGRWPANVIHDGSDEVVGLFPQSNGFGGSHGGNDPGIWKGKKKVVIQRHNDTGSVARFFKQINELKETI